ncbi:hypothetical protein WJX72_007362 [[Myrmecia] bisecta]|uniref:Uncharacterized protein n=1 Tax=[Myrmecia] bisecta TaxID=41462 RepID=A0AAW1Q4N1_9CHLO
MTLRSPPSGRYNIDVHLTGKHFAEDSRYCQKVRDCLKQHAGILTFLDQVPAFYAATSSGQGQLSGPGSQAPLPSSARVESRHLHAFFHWLSALSCGITGAGMEDGDHRMTCDIQSSRWAGFISHSQVAACLEVCRGLVDAGGLPWVALSAWGFADVPVAWGSREHRLDDAGAGDNHFCIVVHPHGVYALYVAAGANSAFTKI